MGRGPWRWLGGAVTLSVNRGGALTLWPRLSPRGRDSRRVGGALVAGLVPLRSGHIGQRPKEETWRRRGRRFGRVGGPSVLKEGLWARRDSEGPVVGGVSEGGALEAGGLSKLS